MGSFTGDSLSTQRAEPARESRIATVTIREKGIGVLGPRVLFKVFFGGEDPEAVKIAFGWRYCYNALDFP